MRWGRTALSLKKGSDFLKSHYRFKLSNYVRGSLLSFVNNPHFTYSFLSFIESFYGNKWVQQIDLLPTEWLHSTVGRSALHRHRRGHWIESRWSRLNFFKCERSYLSSLTSPLHLWQRISNTFITAYVCFQYRQLLRYRAWNPISSQQHFSPLVFLICITIWSSMYVRQFRAIVVLTRNCLASTLDYIVMQMRKTNREKGYRAFSHDVTAAMLVFQNKEMAAMMVYQLILRELNSIFMQIISFVSVIQYGCWSPEWKRSIVCSNLAFYYISQICIYIIYYICHLVRALWLVNFAGCILQYGPLSAGLTSEMIINI